MNHGLTLNAFPVLLVLCLPTLFVYADDPVVREQGHADQPVTQEADEAARGIFRLPGLMVNRQEGYVDLNATVCLEQGFLELIACTRGGKEHESIVAIDARPQHVHLALLLLGARSGHPAIRRQVGEEGNRRWIDLPPQGDLIRVSLLFDGKHGEQVEHPISDFVMHIDQVQHDTGAAKPDEREAAVFPQAFVFAGSLIVETEVGAREYMADRSGHVITVATFGDEVLGLPGTHSDDNAALVWKLNPKTLPPVGTNVKLRLTLNDPPANPTEPVGGE
jgi:hypothetical protein